MSVHPVPPVPAFAVALTGVPAQTAVTFGLFAFNVGGVGCGLRAKVMEAHAG